MKKYIFTVVFFMSSLLVFPQDFTPRNVSVNKPATSLAEKKQRVQIQKLQVVSMVEKTADETAFWEDKKTAIKVLADTADLLWNENPVKAAKWLTNAWNMIDEVADAPKNDNLRQFFSRSDKSDLQTHILRIAQKHEELLAEKFLKQLTEKKSNEKAERGAFDDKTVRSEQLLRLAQQSIETNPNLAFSLAERSLSDGISFGLQNVLTDLRKKNVSLANRLFDLALARFGNSADTSEAQILAGYLFRPGFTAAANSGGGTMVVVNPAQQNLPAVAQSEPQRARDFLSAIYQAFFVRPLSVESGESRRKAESIALLGNFVIGQYDRFAPELAQPAKTFLIELKKQLYPGSENSSSDDSRVGNLPKNATKEEIYEALIADLEDKADKETDPIAKNLAYIKASLTTKPEDYRRGVKIAEKIDDDNLEADAVSFLLYRAALYFVDKKEIDAAEELAPQIKEVLRRSVVKIAVAQFLLQPKDKSVEQFQIDLQKQRAFALLADTERDLKRENSSPNLAKILFGQAAVLVKFDKPQGFNLLDETIQKINKLEKFNLADGSAPYLNIDVWETSGSTVSSPKIGFGFRNVVESLIETDFEQIAAAIDKFSVKETRGVGRLEFAKIFFQKNKDLLKPV